MIQINLIPENLRKKKRKAPAFGGRGPRIPREAVIGLVGGLLVLLIGLHVLLQIFIVHRYFRLGRYNKEWDQVSSSQSNVNRVLAELERLQGNLKAAEEIRGKDWFSWSVKLNEISDQLPRGVWLDWVAVDGKALLIKGSAVSKSNTEIISVHNFTENLGRSESFMKGLKNIETGLIKSRNINATPVADFSISAELDGPKK